MIYGLKLRGWLSAVAPCVLHIIGVRNAHHVPGEVGNCVTDPNAYLVRQPNRRGVWKQKNAELASKEQGECDTSCRVEINP
eukprot:3499868-Pyramimonas_sp.AAC.1